MIKCVSHKKTYPSLEIAEDALIEAHTHYEYGRTGGPVAVYRCEDCGQFHLTSKGPMNARLEKMIREGQIGREKLANQWLNKMKQK